MSDIIRITDSPVDVQSIMHDIRRTIAEKRKDPAYRERLREIEESPLELAEATSSDVRLLNKLQLPPSHRKGFKGRIANAMLGKLFLATKSFLNGVLITQERLNHSMLNSIEAHEQRIDEALKQQESGRLRGQAFDYLAFQNRFRGDQDRIMERQQKYLAYFAGKQPVIDIGSGRGEFLELLRDAGIPATGVDNNTQMVSLCQGKGLTVVQQDALSYLNDLKPGSISGIFASHFVEHVTPEYLLEFLVAARAAMSTDGVLICESPNPLSLSIFARAFYVDPTHLRPVHPEELRFMYEQAGFNEVEFLPMSPLEPAERLEELPKAAGVSAETLSRHNRNIEKLNELLYGFQDYALIGRT